MQDYERYTVTTRGYLLLGLVTLIVFTAICWIESVGLS